MELRLTGASSVLPEQAQQLPEGAVAGRIGDMSIAEEVGRGGWVFLQQSNHPGMSDHISVISCVLQDFKRQFIHIRAQDRKGRQKAWVQSKQLGKVCRIAWAGSAC